MEAVDSFDAVKAWLDKNVDPSKGDISEISDSLRDIHERLMRVRSISPTTDLTDKMWTLMKRAGLPVRKIKSPYWPV